MTALTVAALTSWREWVDLKRLCMLSDGQNALNNSPAAPREITAICAGYGLKSRLPY
jgi:hypothetical protein